MRSDRLYLVDIVEAADAIAGFIHGVDAERFLNDDLVRSAVLHKLAVIGEAAARVSMALRARFPETPGATSSAFAISWSMRILQSIGGSYGKPRRRTLRNCENRSQRSCEPPFPIHDRRSV